jgi:ABC-type glycerol-3-phosphate transport system substrate-binding protein
MSDFIERLKTDRILQMFIGGILILIIILFFLFKPKSSQKTQTLCYNETIKIWLPFEISEISPYIKDFEKYCVKFEIVKKSLEEIKRDIIYSIASGQYPDIVFIDNDFLVKNKDLFTTSTPVFVDSLIAFYNQDILNFLNLQKPKTLDELKNFIKSIKNYRQDFYPIALGTKDVRNRKEIILSLLTLQEDYKNRNKFKENLTSALDIYFSFSDIKNDFFSYPPEAGDDLLNFAKEKTAVYFGFYQDKKEILKLNPRINLSYGMLPFNTFPPRLKIYSKNFYLVQVKKSKSKASKEFIKWFLEKRSVKFSQKFDLVPFIDDKNLSEEKKNVLDAVKNFGETFDFLDKDKLFDNLDKILEVYNEGIDLKKFLEGIEY